MVVFGIAIVQELPESTSPEAFQREIDHKTQLDPEDGVLILMFDINKLQQRTWGISCGKTPLSL